jgi:tetratricopeptide (TPR) repeat protein
MGFPDLKHFGLGDSIAPEPGTGRGRIVLWVAGQKTDGVQRWERIGDASGPEIEQRETFCAAGAVLVPLEQETPTFWQKLRKRVRPQEAEGGWVTPAGEPAKQSGPKRKDLLLVWANDANAAYDEGVIQQHWPESQECRRLGTNLFLVSGVSERQTTSEANQARYQLERLHAREEHFDELSGPENDPRHQAEKMLALAQRSGDPGKQSVALIDLGNSLVRRGETDAGVPHLEQALALARQSGDTVTEYDALTNLGIGYAAAGRVAQAQETFQHVLAHARSVGDRFSEKLVLAELGAVYSSQGQLDQALEHYTAALRLAIELGDRGGEATLAWTVAIFYDELGNREQAIRFGQAAVDIYQQLGSPQTPAFADCLDRCRRGETPLKANTPQVTQQQGHSLKPPSVLRMAHSAAKAMAKFVTSGFKTVSREAHERRLATCGVCEHHIGLRCRLCGCFTRQKSWLPHEHCPAGKWPV